MANRPDPVAAADDEARRIARGLMGRSHAALAYSDAESGLPAISRIAFGLAPDTGAATLISALAPHFAGLSARPDCAILLGEPGEKGDPLTHPRLMLQASAAFVAPDDPGRADLRAHWLRTHPKSALYIDFADFAFVRFTVRSALLNAGFARAYRLAAKDLHA